ncbi:Com family DNA-binding transcriptional regulator [Wohlfahrtiimonas larvae]|uniref:Com family DNA-binding transcriptional regulator n=1 Tax=Wohlfahrtiimonas larvae TaxID=1157986 RepID=UPI0031E73A54
MEKKAIDATKEEIRCQSCNKKLAVGIYVLVEIKCPRCKTLNSFQKSNAKSVF